MKDYEKIKQFLPFFYVHGGSYLCSINKGPVEVTCCHLAAFLIPASTIELYLAWEFRWVHQKKFFEHLLCAKFIAKCWEDTENDICLLPTDEIRK